MKKLKVLDLFSGIGAYSLGLGRSGGFETVAFCESDPYCRKILARHWPDVPVYDDVKGLTGERLRSDGIAADFIVAGWPCQDISVAGTGRGLDGERSGLWPHIVRIARDIRPKGVLLENSTNLLAINGGRDFGTVLGDLAALGLDVEWHCLSAAAFDAPHIRDRLWIVGMAADSDCAGRGERRGAVAIPEEFDSAQCAGEDAADGHGAWEQQSQGRRTKERRRVGDGGSQPNADAAGVGRGSRRTRRVAAHGQGIGDAARNASDPDCIAPIGAAIARGQRHQWEPESGLARVVSKSPNRVDRIRAIGNTNPPIIVETIGRAILEAEAFNAA